MRPSQRCALDICGRRVDRAVRVSTFRYSESRRDRARCPVFCDKANNTGRRACARTIVAGSCRFCARPRACFLRSAKVRARTHPASIGAARASIAAVLKNCRRRRDISRQSRHREKQSREQSDQSARALKLDYVDFRSARAGGAPCLAAAACCTDPRSESV